MNFCRILSICAYEKSLKFSIGCRGYCNVTAVARSPYRECARTAVSSSRLFHSSCLFNFKLLNYIFLSLTTIFIWLVGGLPTKDDISYLILLPWRTASQVFINLVVVASFQNQRAASFHTSHWEKQGQRRRSGSAFSLQVCQTVSHRVAFCCCIIQLHVFFVNSESSASRPPHETSKALDISTI